MAIVFISPIKKQRLFFWSIAGVVISLLFVVSLMAFPPQFKTQLINTIVPANTASSVPTIKINFKVLDSNQVKNLLPFGDLAGEFTYAAQDVSGKKTAGTIMAQSLNEAMLKLAARGLEVISLQDALFGRDEPFTYYYSPTKK